ncbi:hypothetical protein JWG42_14260 [Desulfoprunum benzoelyticum]|uniref:Uncharacterized protein n=1 Tax=Desulfoprunum benzoelyticum TaxID=1506996 RepID=A0A840UTQ1_9BACT|nr:hypothetical protein [Desulfoprunum benzoelyticum]MBB5349567.1 hypothetical protein [Desulfoprunum benzoelyticum]MBM9531320.1 hypothetical protein [Desulfoprunum benzoelyticum]
MEDESHGLLDDDPALDCTPLNEMEKGRGEPGKGGCMTILVVLFLPVVFLVTKYISFFS